MTIDRYFDKFSSITYANTTSVDIIRRVKVLDKYYSSPYYFYPYDISEKERADQFSNRYYKDSYKSWIVYLSNKIIDPYYEWYMHDREFYEFLANKYGSVYNAQTRIKYYRNDWEGVEDIAVNYYDALDNNLKKLPPDLLYFLLYEVTDPDGKNANTRSYQIDHFSKHPDIQRLRKEAHTIIFNDKGVQEYKKNHTTKHSQLPHQSKKNEPLNQPHSSIRGEPKPNPLLDKKINEIQQYIIPQRYDYALSADDVINSYKKELEMLSAEKDVLKKSGITHETEDDYNRLSTIMQEIQDQIEADSSPLGKALLEINFKLFVKGLLRHFPLSKN